MRIIIYTRADCVQCHATKRAMESRGLVFEQVFVDQVPDAAESLRARGSASCRWLSPVIPGGRASART